LDSGNAIVTNTTGDATLEIRNGKLLLNGGTLQVDRFVMTNACAQFVRIGGTLIFGTAVLDPTRDDDGCRSATDNPRGSEPRIPQLLGPKGTRNGLAEHETGFGPGHTSRHD